MTFQDYLKINCESKNTRVNYQNQVNQFLSHYKELTQENLNNYLAKKVDNEISKSTFNVILSALKCYAKFLKVELNFPKQRYIGKKIPSVYLTEKELEESIFPYFKFLFKEPDYYKFLIQFLFYTGIRPNELVNLKVEDISFEKPILIVHNPKDKDDRYAPYPLSLQDEIKKWINDSGKAFNINYVQIKYIFKKINTELNYKKHLTAYSLRHGFAKYMLSKGFSVNEVQKYMGHSNIAITNIYTDITCEDAIQKWIEKERK